MKRRNVEPGKLRRPMKSKKISERVYSYTSLFACMKFLAIWILVLLADFILEFRFEYLYPVWLLFRTVQDSYKYQGILLTMLFVTAAIGTDILCYILIPVQWLFFAASSYVWVQYVWHTDRGICLSSVMLWLLFIYVEAALRMKDQKSLPFNMDLCRPFAAHCIGYPVVTLGYGIKTAASESIRRRTRGKVKKSNIFYHQLLQEALPLQLQESKLTDDLNEDITASSEQQAKKDSKMEELSDDDSECSDVSSSTSPVSTSSSMASALFEKLSSSSHHCNQNNKTDPQKSAYIEDYEVNAENEARVFQLQRRNVNDLNEDAENMLNESRNNKVSNKETTSPSPQPKKLNSKRNKTTTSNSATAATAATTTQSNGGGAVSFTTPPSLNNGHVITANGDSPAVKSDFVISRLDSDIKRLKADLQSSRNTESELRSQLSTKSNDDRQKTVSLAQLQQDNDNLQNKLHNLVMSRQQDKQNLAAVEKKLVDEKKQREKSESQLASERKTKKQEEHVTARAVALANASRTSDCVGDCKLKIHNLEEDNSKFQWTVGRKEERIRMIEAENIEWRRRFEGDPSVDYGTLVARTKALEVRYTHMENSLREETRAKLSLFNAVNEYKRQLDMQAQIMGAKDMEIAGLRSHITEALALVPSSMYTDHPVASGQYTTPKLGSPTIAAGPGQSYIPHEQVYDAKPHSVTPTIASSRFSPTSTIKHELESPSRTPVSDSSNTELNPQAKDYQPGTQAKDYQPGTTTAAQ